MRYRFPTMGQARFGMTNAGKSINSKKIGRIAFLFKRGREARLSGTGPTEFFYGLIQLKRAGYDATIVTDHEFDLDKPPGIFWRTVSHFAYICAGIPLWPLARLARRTARERLNSFDHIFVSTNTFGLCLGLLHRLKVIRPTVFFVAMGLIEPTTPNRVVGIYRWIFRKGVLLKTLSEVDANMMSKKLGFSVGYIPFGVDSSFWVPVELGETTREADEDYVLSIGNDSHRDFETLINCWKPEYPKLLIVTEQSVVATAANIEIRRGNWHKQVLTDEQIRTMIQGTRFVILPIKNTIHPSGQSVCLQAMGCGKAVIITDFPGLWNRELLRSGETCIISGPPGDLSGIQHAVEGLINDPALANKIGNNARNIVESDLNVAVMATTIAAEFDKLGGK